MIVLVDGDIVCFSCAAYNEQWGLDACLSDVDSLMRRICETTGASSCEAFLSGADNFRYQIYPEYKANRRDKIKPVYLEAAREYLITTWGAKIVNGYEADDAIGIRATELQSL